MSILRALSRYVRGCYDNCVSAKRARGVVERAEAVLRALENQQRQAEERRQHSAAEKKIELRAAIQQFAIAKAQIRVAQRLNCLTGIAALFAFLAALGIIWSVFEAREATIEANRAWIAPFAAEPSGKTTEDFIAYNVKFINDGRSPATGQVWNIIAKPIKIPANGDYGSVSLGRNPECDGLEPTQEGGVTYPHVAPMDIPWRSYSGKTVPYADQKNGAAASYLRGCVAYRTMGIIGHSAFCFLFKPIIPDENGLAVGAAMMCKGGNWAD